MQLPLLFTLQNHNNYFFPFFTLNFIVLFSIRDRGSALVRNIFYVHVVARNRYGLQAPYSEWQYLLLRMGSLSESTLCRICAQDTQTFCSLYLESSKDLRHQISFFLPLIVTESSSMPKVVCQRCVTAIGLVSEFFDKLNQGQVKLLTEILGPKKKYNWNGKKLSLFDKKYPSGTLRKSKRKEEEDLPDFEDDNILESDSLKHEDTLENASMRFECLEPSCRLRFPNAEEIENHLKVENHSTMTLVVPSEDVDEENRLDEIPSNSMLQEIKDPCVKDFPITPGAKSLDEQLFDVVDESFYNQEYSLYSSSYLENQRPCDEKNELSCKLCDNVIFESQETLESHLASHTDSNGKNFSCEKCGKQFGYKSSLMQHIKLHGDSRVFKCQFCSKSFSRKGNLQEHLRIHTGEKPFSCNYCVASFKTSSQHKLHEKRHKGEKPWKCELCEKAFLHQSTWKYHMMRHKGDKSFNCSNCKKSFTEPWALKKHMRTHNGEKPYTCQICGKCFSDCSNLSKHSSKVHHQQKKESSNLICEAIKSAYIMTNKDNKNTEEDNVNEVIYITYEGNNNPYD
nr:gastrula zinc finger protein XlCGF26.1-like isoform X2 [Lepeophtheirus salmonis]